MARIRTVKPEFFTDSKTGTLSDLAQILFVGLWCHADDYGVIRFDIEELKARIRPYDPRPAEECVFRPLSEELLPKGLVVAFFLPDSDLPRTNFLWIRGFAKHQKISHPAAPLIPGWTKKTTPIPGQDVELLQSPPENSGKLRKTPESSGSRRARVEEGRGEDRSGEERIGEESSKKEKTTPGATSGTAGTSLGAEELEVLQAFESLVGTQATLEDQRTAEDFIAELGRRLSASKMVEQMRSYVAWCEKNGKAPPRELRWFWKCLRKAADYQADHAAQANRSSSNGFTSAGDVLARQQEEDPF